MGEILLFESDDGNAKTVFLPEENYYILTLKGNIEDDDFKGANMALYREYGERSSRFTLFDLRDVERVNLMARTWYNTRYMPKLVTKYGTRFTGSVIVPLNMYENRMLFIVRKVAEKFITKMTLEFFQDRNEAEQWLRAQIIKDKIKI